MQAVVIQLRADFFQKPQGAFELLLDSGFGYRINGKCKLSVHCSPDRVVVITEILSIRPTAEAAALTTIKPP